MVLPEGDVHEVHPSCQRFVRDAATPCLWKWRLQRQVLENTGPRAEASDHLQNMVGSNFLLPYQLITL